MGWWDVRLVLETIKSMPSFPIPAVMCFWRPVLMAGSEISECFDDPSSKIYSLHDSSTIENVLTARV